MPLSRRLGAEALGTLWLVFGGCGAAVLAASGMRAAGGIGLVGVSLAFGLTVLTGAYALGHISGGHFNPAVTIGLALAKRFDTKDVLPYIGAQLAGAFVGAGAIQAIVAGQPDYDREGNFLAANGFADLSPDGYALAAVLLAEVVTTAMFLFVILGITDRRAPAGFAPLGIGLCLTLIHLITIPVSNTSVNPARSFGPALVMLIGPGSNSQPMEQLWVFIVAPIVGAVLGAIAHGFISGDRTPETAEAEIS